MVLLNIPYVQQKIALLVSGELSSLLHTEVSVRRVNLGLLNRIIVDDIYIADQQKNTLLEVPRLSAKFDLGELVRSKLVIHNIQLYKGQIYLSQKDSLSQPNYRFIIDALSSDDTTSTSGDINLRINSILIRHSRIRYDLLSAEKTPGIFNPNHIDLDELRVNISLKALLNDSINTTVRQLSFNENNSRFALKNLAFKLVANREAFTLSRFNLELPASKMELDTLNATYDLNAKDVLKTLQFKGGINDSYVTLQDLKCFIPSMEHFADRLNLNAKISGNAQEIMLSKFKLNSDNNDILVESNCRVRYPFNPEMSFIDCNMPVFTINGTGMRFLAQNLQAKASPVLTRLGNVSFEGYVRGMFKNLQMKGSFYCGLGSLTSDLTLNINEGEVKNIHGHLKTEGFELGRLINNNDLGSVALNLNINGRKMNQTYPEINIQGNIPYFEYKKYYYNRIDINATSRNGGYKGQLAINDPNVNIQIEGDINTNRPNATCNIQAIIDHLKPNALNLTKQYDDTDFSGKIHANLNGKNPDNITGTVQIDSMIMISPEKYYYLNRFNLTSQLKEEGEREISISSDFLNGKATGRFQFSTLVNGFKNLLNNYLPSFVETGRQTNKNNKRKNSNQLEFDFYVKNTAILSKVFQIPLTIHSPGTLKGYFNERNNRIKLEGYFPSFTYDNTLYESSMILLDNPQDELQAFARITKQMEDEAKVNLSLKMSAYDDRLTTSVNWGNNTNITYSGEFSAITNFYKPTSPENKFIHARVNIQPSDIIINDSIWHLRQSHIVIDSSRVAINNFCFEHDKQYLRINGNLTKESSDILAVNLNNIQLEYIFDILQFHPVDFRGMASGRAIVTQALKNPSLNADLKIKDFAFNKGIMGDMDIKGLWNEEEGNIHLDADIRRGENSRTTVLGFVSPKRDSLDLRINTQNSNLEFLNEYTSGIFDKVTGEVSGPLHLYGPFDQLNLLGHIKGNARAKIGVLRTEYALRFDSVSFYHDAIEFHKASMKDKDNNNSEITGTLAHNHLGDFSYDFTFNTNNLLLYDAPNDTEASIYGSFYGTGIIQLHGGGNELNVDSNIRTGTNTRFIYNMGSADDITDNGFITFVDKTPRPKWKDEINNTKDISQGDSLIEEKTNIHINAQLEVTPDADVKVILDPVSGDYAVARGRGNFQTSYFNKGDFRLYGTYTLDHGKYKLSLQDVIHKEFILQPGGSITFSGLPENGNMNLQAVYTVNSASLKDLAPNATFNQNSVKVNCILNLSGNLATPTIHFDLELPNVDEEERDIVKSYISTDEQMEMQIIYLLGIGRFYTYDYSNNTNDGNDGQSSAMNSLLSSTLSGQLNNMLSNVINSNKWNFGTNLSTGDKGWTDMEIEGMLSGRLLNNRLLINGNFGYRENQMSTTNFIGDFDVQWLLTPSGDISLKGYNQTNDRYFSKTTLTTQGIGILFKRDFTHWKELFIQKDKKKKENDTISSKKQKKVKKKKKKQ